jgi:hypothetical protein
MKNEAKRKKTMQEFTKMDSVARWDQMAEPIESVLNNSVFHLRPPGEVGVLQTVRLLAAARFGQKEA